MRTFGARTLDERRLGSGPYIAGIGPVNFNPSGTAVTVDLPPVIAGDLLVAFIHSDGDAGSINPAADWSYTSSYAQGSALQGRLHVHLCDGTEGATLNLTSANSTPKTTQAVSVRGARHFFTFSTSASAGSSFDAGSVPAFSTGGASNATAVAHGPGLLVVSVARDDNAAVTGFPATIPDNQVNVSHPGTGPGYAFGTGIVDVPFPQLAIGSFTGASDQWGSFSVLFT